MLRPHKIATCRLTGPRHLLDVRSEYVSEAGDPCANISSILCSLTGNQFRGLKYAKMIDFGQDFYYDSWTRIEKIDEKLQMRGAGYLPTEVYLSVH